MSNPSRYDPAAAIAKWPNVPACYGWLALDRRGQWRFQGERVTHTGLISFLNTFYQADSDGHWLVQNGPQKVFVELEYMPLIARFDGEGALLTHTGKPVGGITEIRLDADGNILLATDSGPCLLEDRDLAAFFEQCRTAGGASADDAALMAALAGQGNLHWRGHTITALGKIDAPAHFGFVQVPVAPMPEKP